MASFNMTNNLSEEDKKILLKISQALDLLDEYVCSSKNMDEQTYRNLYENKSFPMIFVQHEPLGGDFDVYRSRMADSIMPDEDITNPSTFSYMPKKKCSASVPSIQRCNFSGQSVFYASMSAKTNFREIDKGCCTGKCVYISKWHIDSSANANMFRIIPPEGVEVNEDYKGYLKIDTKINYQQYTTEYLRKLGKIFMNDEDNENTTSKYFPCALISNFIYNYKNTGKPVFQGLSSRYDGILYPSVKDKDRCMLNAAFTQNFIDKYAKLVTVVKGIVNEDIESIKIQMIGFCHNTKIIWYRPILLKNSIKLTNCLYIDNRNKIHDTYEGKIFDKNHKEIKNNCAMFFVDFDQWKENVTIDIDDIKEESFEKSIKNAFVVRNLTGWTLENGHCTINIVKVIFYYEYQITLERM